MQGIGRSMVLIQAADSFQTSLHAQRRYALSTHHTCGIELDHSSYRLNRPLKSDFTTANLESKSSQLHTSITDINSTSDLDCFVIYCPEHH